MRSHFCGIGRGAFLSLAGAFLLLAGCDFGTYNQRYEATWESLNKQTPYVKHLLPDAKAIEAPGVNTFIRLRLPKTFEKAEILAIDSEARKDTDRIEMELPWAGPPVPWKGVGFLHKQELQAGAKLNAWLVAYAIDAASVKRADLQAGIAAALKEAVPSAAAAFVPLQTTAPDGKSIEYGQLSVIGNMPFDGIANRIEDAEKKFPSRHDIYIFSSPDRHIVIRAKTSVDADKEIRLFETIVPCLGTLVLDDEGARKAKAEAAAAAAASGQAENNPAP